jgi:hypothetical protein
MVRTWTQIDQLLLCAVQTLWTDQEAQLAAGLLAHDSTPAGDDLAAALALSAHFPSSTGGHAVNMANNSGWEVLQEVVLPVAILLLGVGFSIAALWVAVSAFVPSS